MSSKSPQVTSQLVERLPVRLPRWLVPSSRGGPAGIDPGFRGLLGLLDARLLEWQLPLYVPRAVNQTRLDVWPDLGPSGPPY